MKEKTNFWTRLINVLYGLGWIVLLVVVGTVIFITKPYEVLDNDKSYITCLSNKSIYTYSRVNDYIYKLPNRTELGLFDIEEKARYLCEKVSENQLDEETQKRIEAARTAGISETQIQQEALEYQRKKNSVKTSEQIYKNEEVNLTKGSWLNTALWAGGTFVVLSIILDLLRSTLLYLVMGRKIQIGDFVIVKLLSSFEVSSATR